MTTPSLLRGSIATELSIVGSRQVQPVHQRRRHGVLARVSASMGELDQMTQQNAALVEQSTAAAESLKEQTGRLAEVIDTFKLSAAGALALAPRAAWRT